MVETHFKRESSAGKREETDENKPHGPENPVEVKTEIEPAVGTPSPLPTSPLPPSFILPKMDPSIKFGVPGMEPVAMPNVTAELLEVLYSPDWDQQPTINVFGVAREVRHYDSTAIVFRNWDDPRQLLFSWNDSRYLVVVDNEYEIECELNGACVQLMIYEKPHRFRLSTTTTLMLYIDDIGYDGYSAGPATMIVPIGGRLCFVRIEGASPNVDIGPKRQDLVAGKVTLLVNDRNQYELFLDSKAQKIEFDGYTLVFIFIDSLKAVLVNGLPFKVDFEGMFHAFLLHGQLIFFRFSILPFGIEPGTVQIDRMMTLSPGPPASPSSENAADEEDPPLPNIPQRLIVPLPDPIIFKNYADPSVFTGNNNSVEYRLSGDWELSFRLALLEKSPPRISAPYMKRLKNIPPPRPHPPTNRM